MTRFSRVEDLRVSIFIPLFCYEFVSTVATGHAHLVHHRAPPRSLQGRSGSLYVTDSDLV